MIAGTAMLNEADRIRTEGDAISCIESWLKDFNSEAYVPHLHADFLALLIGIANSEWMEQEVNNGNLVILVGNGETMRDAKELSPQECMNGLRAAFKANPDYAYSWHCNIAMACHDAILAGDREISEQETEAAHKVGNQAASAFMRLCFGTITKHPNVEDGE